jgi:hypothetical protein
LSNQKILPSSLPSIRLVPEPPDPHHSRNPLGSTNSPPSLPRQHIFPAHILDHRPPPLRSSRHCTNSKTQKDTRHFSTFSTASDISHMSPIHFIRGTTFVRRLARTSTSQASAPTHLSSEQSRGCRT